MTSVGPTATRADVHSAAGPLASARPLSAVPRSGVPVLSTVHAPVLKVTLGLPELLAPRERLSPRRETSLRAPLVVAERVWRRGS